MVFSKDYILKNGQINGIINNGFEINTAIPQNLDGNTVEYFETTNHTSQSSFVSNNQNDFYQNQEESNGIGTSNTIPQNYDETIYFHSLSKNKFQNIYPGMAENLDDDLEFLYHPQLNQPIKQIQELQNGGNTTPILNENGSVILDISFKTSNSVKNIEELRRQKIKSIIGKKDEEFEILLNKYDWNLDESIQTQVSYRAETVGYNKITTDAILNSEKQSNEFIGTSIHPSPIMHFPYSKDPQFFTLPSIAIKQFNNEEIAEAGPSIKKGRPKIYDENEARKRHNISSKIHNCKKKAEQLKLKKDVEKVENLNSALKITLPKKFNVLLNLWNPTLYIHKMSIDERKTAEQMQSKFDEICQEFIHLKN